MNTAIITLTLAMAPTSYAPAAPFDVADAEVVTQDNSSHLVTYDAEGDVSASVVIWAEPSGRLHLDADFADGRYLSATINGARADIDSDDSTGCVTGAVFVGCTCLPLLAEEGVEVECP